MVHNILSVWKLSSISYLIHPFCLKAPSYRSKNPPQFIASRISYIIEALTTFRAPLRISTNQPKSRGLLFDGLTTQGVDTIEFTWGVGECVLRCHLIVSRGPWELGAAFLGSRAPLGRSAASLFRLRSYFDTIKWKLLSYCHIIYGSRDQLFLI